MQQVHTKSISSHTVRRIGQFSHAKFEALICIHTEAFRLHIEYSKSSLQPTLNPRVGNSMIILWSHLT